MYIDFEAPTITDVNYYYEYDQNLEKNRLYAEVSIYDNHYAMSAQLGYVGTGEDADGNTVLRQEPTVIRQVIREETSETMCALLESVVTEGTAKNAAVSGYRIGGKTGTSEKIDVFDENGKPTLDKIVSFVGVAPMDDPEYIVLVALDTPSKSTGIYISGGVMAAPTVGAVMADILPYLGAKQQFAPDDPAGKIVIMPQLLGFTAKEAEKALKNAGLAMTGQGSGDSVTAQIPAAGQPLPGGSHALVYFGEAEDMTLVEVPNFYGMNRQQASDAAGRLGLYILVSGNPKVDLRVTVTNQETAPGIMVPKGTTIRLEFTDMAAAD
jgi:stage V sporulation protein D (sporulation-specific penicillin-binding protein)